MKGPTTKEMSQLLSAPIHLPLNSWKALESKVLVQALDLGLVFLSTKLLSGERHKDAGTTVTGGRWKRQGRQGQKCYLCGFSDDITTWKSNIVGKGARLMGT